MLDEALTVPAVQDARFEVVGVGDEERVVDPERVPVVCPLRRDPLELDEARAVPLVDHRVAVRPWDVRELQSLGDRQEVTLADLPVLPLLRGVGLDRLELGERPAVHSWIVDSSAYSYGPDPERMLATARNERAPIEKNSASSPPGAGIATAGT